MASSKTVTIWSIIAGVVVVAGAGTAVALTRGDGTPTASTSTTTASGTATRSRTADTSTPTATPGASTPTDGGTGTGSTPGSTGTGTGTGAGATGTSTAGTGTSGTGTSGATGTGTAAATVTPFITFGQWVASSSTLQVGADVQGIRETGGTCTVTATMGAARVSGSFPATPSATTTECGSMSLTSSQFTTGTWSVVVAYASATSAGTSSAFPVVIG